MSRRPARVTQAEIARVIRAAKQAGASEVVVPVDGGQITIKLSTAKPSLLSDDGSQPSEKPVAETEEIVL
jgi:hypothetical protein